VKFPELSLEGLHASETLNGVLAETRKFPGFVGAERSWPAVATNALANKAEAARRIEIKWRHGVRGFLMLPAQEMRIANIMISFLEVV
jgi:hypothetical protein